MRRSIHGRVIELRGLRRKKGGIYLCGVGIGPRGSQFFPYTAHGGLRDAGNLRIQDRNEDPFTRQQDDSTRNSSSIALHRPSHLFSSSPQLCNQTKLHVLRRNCHRRRARGGKCRRQGSAGGNESGPCRVGIGRGRMFLLGLYSFQGIIEKRDSHESGATRRWRCAGGHQQSRCSSRLETSQLHGQRLER
jgi:hypothetical protein